MPALREIERSAPMVRWRRSRLGGLGLRSWSELAELLPDHLRPDGLAAATIPARRREVLLGRLDWLERTSVNGDAGPGAPSERELADLADDVSYWVRRDDAFATELVELSTSNMTVARLLGAASFPSSFGSRIVQHMAMPNGPDSGVDHDRYAASLGVALEQPGRRSGGMSRSAARPADHLRPGRVGRAGPDEPGQLRRQRPDGQRAGRRDPSRRRLRGRAHADPRRERPARRRDVRRHGPRRGAVDAGLLPSAVGRASSRPVANRSGSASTG